MGKMNAEEMLKLIEELSEEEKKKFLDSVFDEYFEGGGAVRFSSVQFDSKKEL